MPPCTLSTLQSSFLPPLQSLDSVLKSRDITLLTKVHIVKGKTFYQIEAFSAGQQSPLEAILPPRDINVMRRCQLSQRWGCHCWASRRQRSGTLPRLLQCTGQPCSKHCLAQMPTALRLRKPSLRGPGGGPQHFVSGIINNSTDFHDINFYTGHK